MTSCISYYEFGGESISPDNLDEPVLSLYHACRKNSSCTVVDVRQEADNKVQTIIADFGDGAFESANPVGIYRNERLAITYRPNDKFPWTVRALRKNFPLTGHQYHATDNQPRPLCLYLAPWESVERSWTPELFVKRILWWLQATAEGTLHKADQPVEQLFYASPYTIVLPKDHFLDGSGQSAKKLVFNCISAEDAYTQTLIGEYVQGTNSKQSFCTSLSLLLEPVEYGPIEGFAHNLGILNEILKNRNCDLLQHLKITISELVTEAGLVQNSKEIVLLILGIPRVLKGEPLGVEIQGFAVEADICKLGEMLAVLYRDPVSKKYYKELSFNGTTMQDSGEWKSISLQPVNISSYPNNERVRLYSGIASNETGPAGIIAGVGALGGLVAQIWSRECWGDWSFIDPDIIQAHNVIRHIANHQSVGHPKATVVSALVTQIHPPNFVGQRQAFVCSVDSGDEKMQALIEGSDLVVDATTTISIPRVLAQNDKCPRTVSIFLTPSGASAVMLLEDANRKIRCNSLEAQYYRAILDSEWGKNHLVGNKGTFFVGGGCREITLALSNEMLHIHAGNLARQVRNSVISDLAKICIWEYEDATGTIQAREVKVFLSLVIEINDWKIVLDEGFLNEASQLRSISLPLETGGVLCGIVDQKDKTITLVKACSAPENSSEAAESFIRAGYKNDFIKDYMQRTADIVTYVGEWHSHPEGVAPVPSELDLKQHSFIRDSVSQEGLPALMMIVADDSVGLYIEGSSKILSITELL